MTHNLVFIFSSCKITGNGKPTATIRLPLKGCGTLQVNISVYKGISIP